MSYQACSSGFLQILSVNRDAFPFSEKNKDYFWGANGVMKLFSNIREEYFYTGEDFDSDLVESKDWIAQKSGIDQYQVFPHVGVGTLRINNIPIPIKLNLELTADAEGAKHISLSTRTRPEHYFIFILFAALICIPPLAFKKAAWVVIYPIILWFPVHAFFQFVIRVQEEMLVTKLVKKLRLKHQHNA
jgi:hypothetical protein